MKAVVLACFMLLSPQLSAVDRDDHECRVFLNHAGWNSLRGDFSIEIITPKREMFFVPSIVKVLLRFHHGDWTERMASLVRADDKYRYYQVTYKPSDGGHPSMVLDFIAFIEVGLDRWFDHNWHYGRGGYISLDRSNGWKVHDMVPHCFR